MVTTQAVANIFDHFDRNLLTPYAVGFDRVFDRLNNYVVHQNHMTPTGFPPYNIRKEGDYNFVIELALAGLSKDDLEIEIADQTLTIRSIDKKEDEGELLHRGISYRQFTRTWTLAENVVVNEAKMENGMLVVRLEHVVPEEKKPRKVSIK